MLSEEKLLPLLDGRQSISLINGPNLCVVGGPAAAMSDFQSRLQEHEIIFRPVRNVHGFHSRMLDPISDSFGSVVRQIHLNTPRIPFISNVTGTWITAEQACEPSYWVDHARRTARFSDALAAMWKLPGCLPIEIGPGRTLGVLAMQHPARSAAENQFVLSSLRHDYENQPDPDFILNSVGRLWLAGVEFDWEKLVARPGPRKISLPAYPFEKQRCWIEPSARQKPAGVAKTRSGQVNDLADWFYIPSWERTAGPDVSLGDVGDELLWLVLSEKSDFANRCVNHLRHHHADVRLAYFGGSYSRRHDGTYEIRAGCLEDYIKLVEELKVDIKMSLNIVHLGALSARVHYPHDGYHESDQDLGFYSLLNLAKAIGEQDISIPVRVGVFTSQIHEVTGEEELNPVMASILGPCGVMPKEYPNITSFSVDLPAMPSTDRDLSELVLHVLGEFRDPQKGGVIAYRGRYRWERSFKPYNFSGPRD
jgi:acyl transferase domain-containing protein